MVVRSVFEGRSGRIKELLLDTIIVRAEDFWE
jgi:hypothetical protein